jgi:hypothetical protein
MGDGPDRLVVIEIHRDTEEDAPCSDGVLTAIMISLGAHMNAIFRR